MHKIEGVRGAIMGMAQGITSRLGTIPEHPLANSGSLTGAKSGQQPVPVVVESSSVSYLETGRQILAPILSPLGTLAIVLIVTIFISRHAGGPTVTHNPTVWVQ